MGAECVGSCDSRSNRTVGERLLAVIGKIISGGQTGADRGALEAALKAGFAYGGLVPKGRLADQYLARFIEDQVEGSDSK